MNLFLLYVFIKLNEDQRNPFQLAWVYGLVAFVGGLIFSGFSWALVVHGFFSFVFCFAFLKTLEYFEDDFGAWLLTLIIGFLLCAGAGKLILDKFI